MASVDLPLSSESLVCWLIEVSPSPPLRVQVLEVGFQTLLSPCVVAPQNFRFVNDVCAINLIVMPNSPNACTGIKNYLCRVTVSYFWEDALLFAAAPKVIVLGGDGVK